MIVALLVIGLIYFAFYAWSKYDQCLQDAEMDNYRKMYKNNPPVQYNWNNIDANWRDNWGSSQTTNFRQNWVEKKAFDREKKSFDRESEKFPFTDC